MDYEMQDLEPRMPIKLLDSDEIRDMRELAGNGPLFALTGIVAAVMLTSLGAAVGISKASIGITALSDMRPDLVMKSMLPVVLSGINSLYGLIVGIMISIVLTQDEPYTLFQGYMHFGAGITVGICGLLSGYAIGGVAKPGIRATGQQPRIYVGLVVVMMFAEAFAVYGFIIAFLMFFVR